MDSPSHLLQYILRLFAKRNSIDLDEDKWTSGKIVILLPVAKGVYERAHSDTSWSLWHRHSVSGQLSAGSFALEALTGEVTPEQY